MSESDCGSISDADVVPPRRVAAASGCNAEADTPLGKADKCMKGNDDLENADADENGVPWLVSKMDAFMLHFKCWKYYRSLTVSAASIFNVLVKFLLLQYATHRATEPTEETGGLSWRFIKKSWANIDTQVARQSYGSYREGEKSGQTGST